MEHVDADDAGRHPVEGDGPHGAPELRPALEDAEQDNDEDRDERDEEFLNEDPRPEDHDRFGNAG